MTQCTSAIGTVGSLVSEAWLCVVSFTYQVQPHGIYSSKKDRSVLPLVVFLTNSAGACSGIDASTKQIVSAMDWQRGGGRDNKNMRQERDNLTT